MKMEVQRRQIIITPENETDTAYIEDTLGLKNEHDFIKLRRINAARLSCIAHLVASKELATPENKL